MTERREDTPETKDNARDNLDEAPKDRKKDATPDAVEEEEATGGGGVVGGDDDRRKTRE